MDFKSDVQVLFCWLEVEGIHECAKSRCCTRINQGILCIYRYVYIYIYIMQDHP